jgi:hypothetical protein
MSSASKHIPYSNTTIPPERTKADIEKLLKEHGVTDIQWTTFEGETTLRFLWKVTVKGVEKTIMFQFAPPVIPSTKRTWTGMRYERVNVNLEATAYRLLWHYLKNKLEAVRWGLESMEKEFLSHAVVSLPDGKQTTVGEHIQEVLSAVKSPALTYNPQREDKIIDGEVTKEAES